MLKCNYLRLLLFEIQNLIKKKLKIFQILMTFIKFLEIKFIMQWAQLWVLKLKPTLDLIKYTKVIAIANKIQ